jgi:predicted transcriptional regulator
MSINQNNFITIQGWMRTELNLKGNDLLVYAIIYGFSQTENQRFTGSLQYLADWCGATKQGILKNLKNLLDLGLIEKNEIVNNGVKFVEYYSTQFNGVLNSVERGVKQSLINNIANSKTEIKEKTNSKELVQNSPSFEFGKQKPKKESLFTKCVTLVDDFVDTHNCGNPVRRKLISYLNFRLSVKDKPLYTNMWKGMLNKLDKLHQEGYAYESIIDFCIERGYLSFYPPTSYSKDLKDKPWEQGVKSEGYTEEEKRQIEKESAERLARGEKVWF